MLQGKTAQKEVISYAKMQQIFQCNGTQVQQAVRSVYCLEDPR